MSTETVREIQHRVRVDLPADAPKLRDPVGRLRRPTGLRLEYGVRRDVARVDVTVEFRNSASHWPPTAGLPDWLRRIIDAHRPADVDNPDANRRTGVDGWPLPDPVVPEGDVPGFYDSEHLHALVVRGLRAVGFTPENADALAAAHRQDVFFFLTIPAGHLQAPRLRARSGSPACCGGQPTTSPWTATISCHRTGR